MKTWLKLWIVALSLVAMATTIYTQTVKADPSAEVKVTIIEGQNHCDPMSGYVWADVSASISEVNLTGITNPLYCYLLRDADSDVTFTLTSLNGQNSNATIANTQFTIGIDAWVFTWSLTQGVVYWPAVYSQWWDVYNKNIHEVWEFTKNITIEWVVPAWKPVDVYTWQLNINVPNT